MAPSDLSPVAAFWRNPKFRICMAVCDTRRGRKEGEESEKVLAFYPSSASQGLRTAIVGLGQAFSSFSSSFSPTTKSIPVVKFVEADKNRWAILELHGPHDDDRGLLLMMVVNKAWAGPGSHNEAMQHCLTLLQSQSQLLHGPLYDLIAQDPSVSLVRRHIQPLVEELSKRIQSKDSSLLPSLSNPLAMHSGLPLLHTSQKALINAQCLANGLMLVSSAGERIVTGSLVCWKVGGHPIWCGGPLSTEDCVTLSQFTARALIQKPRPMAASAVEAASGAAAALPSMILGGLSGQAAGAGEGSNTLLNPRCWTRASPVLEAAESGPRLPSSSSSAAGSSSTTYSLLKPPAPATTRAKATSLPHEGQGGTFFIVPRSPTLDQSAAATSDGASALPTTRVWVDGLKQYCRLLPYHHGSLIVIVLIRDQELTREAVESITEVLSLHSPSLSSLLNKELPSSNLWHVPGYRYYNQDKGMVRASPSSKVKTLSSSAMSSAASSIDRMQSASETKLVTAVRGYAEGSTWVVARIDGDKTAITTMEKVPELTEKGLPAAVSHARKVLL